MEEEELTFKVNKNALYAQYPNQYAVIYSEEILGVEDNLEDATLLGKNILGEKKFLVKQILP